MAAAATTILPRGLACRSSSRESVLALCPSIRQHARSEYLILTLAIFLRIRIWQSGRGYTFVRAMSRSPCTSQLQTLSRHGRQRQEQVEPIAGWTMGAMAVPVLTMATGRTNRRWEPLEEQPLLAWRKERKPWKWIFHQFPDRSEGTVRLRWHML